MLAIAANTIEAILERNNLALKVLVFRLDCSLFCHLIYSPECPMNFAAILWQEKNQIGPHFYLRP